MPEMRVCPECGVERELERDFYKHKKSDRANPYYDKVCIICQLRQVFKKSKSKTKKTGKAVFSSDEEQRQAAGEFMRKQKRRLLISTPRMLQKDKINY